MSFLIHFLLHFVNVSLSCVCTLIAITKTPIVCGREPTATEEEKKLGIERSAELSAKVNQVI